MDLTVIGTVGLDDIRTPFGDHKGLPGGSATHFAVAASHLVKVGVVGVVGDDYPAKHLELLRKLGIDTQGIEAKEGKSFQWQGAYDYDMNSAQTLDTQLGVLTEFDPKLTEEHQNCNFFFLANVDPDIQNKVLDQLDSAELIFLDSMNFWIEGKRESLTKAIRRVDGVLVNEEEARQFCNTPNLIKAGNEILALGPRFVIIKKGEHGALFFSKEFSFVAVAYPTEKIVDPTGAGDSFAGGFMAYLAKQNKLDETTLKEAVNFGTVMASFMVEDFSYNGLLQIGTPDLIHRYNELQRFIHFEPLEEL